MSGDADSLTQSQVEGGDEGGDPDVSVTTNPESSSTVSEGGDTTNSTPRPPTDAPGDTVDNGGGAEEGDSITGRTPTGSGGFTWKSHLG